MQLSRTLRRLSSFTLLSLAVTAMPAMFGQSLPAVPSRVVEHVDDARVVRLDGNTHPSAQPRFDQGPADPTLQLKKIVLVLKRSPEQEQALADFNKRQYDPKSPDFHHWLTATEFGELYGPSDSDIFQITNWLQNHGLAVDEVAKGRAWIHFSGTVSQLQQAFHLELHNYLVSGETHIANDRDPSIPTALAPVITGIGSLHNFFPKPAHHTATVVTRDPKSGKFKRVQSEYTPELRSVEPQPLEPSSPDSWIFLRPEYSYTSTEGFTHEDVTPYDFATIYNVLPLWQAATPINGTGITVAVVANYDVDMSDITKYRSIFGLPATNAIHTIQTDPSTDPGTGSGDDDAENELDLEMLSAAAPGATLDLVVSADTTTTQGPVLSAMYIVDHEVAPIATASYGECELALQAAGNAQMNQIWQQGATEGITLFVSSGDTGSAGCDSQNTAGPSPDTVGVYSSGWATPTYVTAVGGTDLGWYYDQATNPSSTYWNSTPASNGATAKGYMPEIAWNDSCSNPLLLKVFTDGSTGEPFINSEAFCQRIDTNANLKGIVKELGGSGGQSYCTTITNNACSGGYAKPSYQPALGSADTHRDVPDIALFSAGGYDSSLPAGVDIPSSAILGCISSLSSGVCEYSASEIVYQEIGGTSAASPYSAGVMAMILQKNGGQKQGMANPVFYKMAATQSATACSSDTVAAGNSCYFHDITRGSNAMVCKAGGPFCTAVNSGDTLGILGGGTSTNYTDFYNAGTGYDATTGVGSMNVANVVNGWAAIAGTTTKTYTLSLSPTSLAFGTIKVGSTSAAQVVTVKNTGTAALTLTSETVSAPFLKSATTCTTSLAVGASCTISVEYKPTATGASTGTLVVASNGTSSPASVALTGTGATYTLSFTPTSLAFGTETVGSTTAAQVVTVKNTGTGALTLTSETVSAPFVKSATTCGSSLAVGASCTVSVEYKPTAASASTGTLAVASNGTSSPASVALTGTGKAATTMTLSLSPTSLAFGTIKVGSTSAAQVVTVKNTERQH